jgi:hypothetical protein
MRIASAIPNARHLLDPYEVDAYQAGPHAYATRHQLAGPAVVHPTLGLAGQYG